VITDDVSYVWVGGRPIQKRETATGRLLESYNGEEQTLYAADGTLTRYFLLKDYLGSVVAKTDVSGNILERIDYDAYGQRKQRQVRDASGTLSMLTSIPPPCRLGMRATLSIKDPDSTSPALEPTMRA